MGNDKDGRPWIMFGDQVASLHSLGSKIEEFEPNEQDLNMAAKSSLTFDPFTIR